MAIRYTTTTTEIPVDAALALLHTTAWAATMPRADLVQAMAHSVCVGALDGDTLVGFGRAITDHVTFVYWTDIVVDASRRGAGIGKGLVRTLLAHPALQVSRRTALLTRDAQGLYAPFGFTEGAGTSTYMEIKHAAPSP
jgi:ribosomal protein S18 acetylase RimI-like enzyme